MYSKGSSVYRLIWASYNPKQGVLLYIKIHTATFSIFCTCWYYSFNNSYAQIKALYFYSSEMISLLCTWLLCYDDTTSVLH